VIQELTANSAVNFQQLVNDAEGRDTSARLRQGSRVSARLLAVPPQCRVSSDPQSCVPRCSLRSLFRQSECSKPFFLFVIIIVVCGVTDYTAEAAVDHHFSVLVIDKAKLPELIHEIIDP
jgi:hypothetical protein